jgi:hypothetical protein
MPIAMKSSPWPLLLVAVSLVGCGPEVRDRGATDWVLAGLSDRGVGTSSALSVVQWDFDAEGDVTVTTLSTNGACGNSSRTLSYMWHGAEPSTIEITDLDGGPMDGGGGGGWDRVVLEVHEGCEPMDGTQVVDMVRYKDGKETSRAEAAYVRGKVCLEDLPPCPPDQVECDSCRTVWCDGEPPEPLECER